MKAKITGLAVAAALVAVLAALSPTAAQSAGTKHANHAFACYSRGQSDPGVWEESNTAVFTANDYVKGYWRPWAVQQDVSTTRVGNYFLTCTLPAGAAGLGTYVTDGGSVLSADAANVDGRPTIGSYPIAGPEDSGRTLVGQFGFDASGSGACGPPVKDFTIVLTQNGQPVTSLAPGAYWLTVTDHCANHNFELRSCPGSTSACDPASGGTEEQITSVNETPGTVTMKIVLVPGTYRLFCDALTSTGVSHEVAFHMYTDFSVGHGS